MPARYCAPMPDSASPGGLIDAAGMVRNSRHASTSRPTLRPLHLHDQQPRPQVRRGALEPEARAHVDGRHDLAAREHHAVDERRRVRHARHLLDHLDVRHVVARQRVGGAGDDEENVVVGARARSCDLLDPRAARHRGGVEDQHRRARHRGRWRRQSLRRESADRPSSGRRSRAGRRCDRPAARRPPHRCRRRTRETGRAGDAGMPSTDERRMTGSAPPRYGVTLRCLRASGSTPPRAR